MNGIVPVMPTGKLSLHKMAVAELVAAGKSNKEIAAELGYSVGVIRNYVHQIYAQLGIPPSRAALALWWHRRPGPRPKAALMIKLLRDPEWPSSEVHLFGRKEDSAN